jgi:hypothetical protein
VADITIPPQPLLAVCPQCQAERGLPREWQELALASMTPEQAEQWDGQLRCLNGHEPAVMEIRECGLA